jgi:NAD(P)-dependent dehydrogenase (short-subunit alcohol dehydrogenase family)
MVENIFSVESKIIVVTGGMGQLGRQFSKALLLSNARVVVLDIHVDEKRFFREIEMHPNDEKVLLISCDITKAVEIQRAHRKILEKWGEAPYGLINNAALDSPPDSAPAENGAFEEYPEESWDRVMDVNVKGPFLLCKIFGKEMAKLGRGSIINVSSIYGALSPNQTIYEYRRAVGDVFYKPVAYSASKSALFNFTRYLATYWAKSGVRVNTVVFAGVFNEQDKEFLASYEALMPMGRMANEDEYNGAILFLLSNASSYMTGSTLSVDGGWSAW